MKRASIIAVCFLLAAMVSTAFAAPSNIKYVGSWSSLSLYKNFEKPFWGEKVPGAFPGVEVEVTSFDQMGMKGAEVFRLLGMKLFGVGATVADYVVADEPVLAGLDLPALAPEIETARKVADAYKPVLDEVMQKTFSAKLISVAPYPAQVIFCNDEIASLEDLKGKKVRASGRTTGDFIDAVGATAVTLAFSEVPQSLQRGVVDCAVTGSLSGYSAGWGEVAKFLYPLPVGGWDHVVTGMSMDIWNGFSESEQGKLLDLAKNELEDAVWEANDYETQQGFICLTGTGDCDFGDPNQMKLGKISEGDIELARKMLTEKVLPRWASTVDEKWVKRWNETVGKATGLKAVK